MEGILKNIYTFFLGSIQRSGIGSLEEGQGGHVPPPSLLKMDHKKINI